MPPFLTTLKRSYNWQSSSTPEQVQAFLSSTRRLASFPPACCTDESFDVYVLDVAERESAGFG
jgi:hypothetical protein